MPKAKSEESQNKGGNVAGDKQPPQSEGSRTGGFVAGILVGFAAGAGLLAVLSKQGLLPVAMHPPLGEGSCPACPTCAACPAVKDTGCKQELGQLQGHLKELKSQQAAAAECKGQLKECQGAAATAQAKAAQAAAAEAKAAAAAQAKASAPPVVRDWPRGTWPQCIERDVALRRRGFTLREKDEALLKDLRALLGSTVTGCRMGNCAATDTFETPRAEDCAHACAVLDRCSFWSHGGQDGSNKCLLRSSAAGDEAVPGFVSAAKACVPPATKVSPKQTVFAVLDSQSLGHCDGGVVSAACPNLHDAMRTWSYAIQSLKTVLAGKEHNFANFVEQITNDADYFLAMEETAPNLGEMYGIGAANNRQVLDAMRSWLQTADGSSDEAQISSLDVSVPRPARGLLCVGPCTAA